MDDCNKYKTDAELESRLACLQSNNNELRDTIAELNKHMVRDDSQYDVISKSSGKCLWGSMGTSSHLGACGDENSWWRFEKVR